MFIDILGNKLERGDRVAFAQTRGGTLALARVIEERGGELRHDNWGREYRTDYSLRVRLESSGREINLPYTTHKYVVVEKAASSGAQVSLSTRCLQAVQNLCATGLEIVDIGNVRASLNLPFSESHGVYVALESLVESGELRRAAFPRYAYMLGE